MSNDYTAIIASAEEEINHADSTNSLYQVKTKYLGKSGVITKISMQMRDLSPENRKEFGQKLNQIKTHVEALLDSRGQSIAKQELGDKLKQESLDLSLPTDRIYSGSLHPISQTIEETITIFGNMGFHVAEGPEIESDWFNFNALNIPPSHPARQMQDSFYVNHNDDQGNALVLRTHTSPVQIRALINEGVPLRVIAPGRTYRSDSDMTHTPMFHQIEGIVIDKKTHFGHLKGVLHDFCAQFFEVDFVPLRFRPSYFPFTEPSAEVDVGCSRDQGGLKIGAGDSWMEILGSGMVHPQVLKNVGLDPNEWQGFAFGVGIERIAMLKYGIPDLRTFFDADQNWIKHYGFSAWQNPCLLRSLVA